MTGTTRDQLRRPGRGPGRGPDRRPLVAPVALLPALVGLGVLVLVVVSTSGPASMLHDSGRRYVFLPPTHTASVATDGTPGRDAREITKGVHRVANLAWVGNLVAVAVLLFFVLVLAAGVRWLWVNRWHPPEAPPEVDFTVAPDRVVDALLRDRDAQLESVDRGSPRNGIVACWLRLQESLTAAGIVPDVAETAGEYVVRTLHSLDLDPRVVSGLASLYREARFSEHTLTEEARDRARAALAALHRELAQHGTAR